ncbi:MAG: metal-dependent phosphohydrolase [Gammaproteobacteria bacterium]
MLNVTKVLTDIVDERATAHFEALYPAASGTALDFVRYAAGVALEAIGTSDALYHNIEHTTHVTLVGLEILKGRQEQQGDVPVRTWANVVVALLCHDIGYVRSLCRADTAFNIATGQDGPAMRNVDGASDAVLMPVHVNRGKRFIEETFAEHRFADVDFINTCIERTRFPVPEDPAYQGTADFPGLVRAADLIGQLSDPRYLNKLTAIFFEFEEIGFNEMTGYDRPGDLLTGYPAFFERHVQPYIIEASAYLEHSAEGRDILAHLYANLERARASIEAPLANAANG